MTRRSFVGCTAAVAGPEASAQTPPDASEARRASFLSARPVWLEGREKEMNLLAGFRAAFDSAGGPVRIRLAASTCYRLYVNGRFRAFGPARSPHGYHRVDEFDLTSLVKPGRNLVAIEVLATNANTYAWANQAPFLQAEVWQGSRIVASTAGEGNQFAAAVVREYVQRVPRYSFQRGFAEVYRMGEGATRWRSDPEAAFASGTLVPLPPKNLLVRGVAYPAFALRQPVQTVSHGLLAAAAREPAPWRPRFIAGVGPQFLGFREEEFEANPVAELLRIETRPGTAAAEPFAANREIVCEPDTWRILDFGVNLTGFPGAGIAVEAPAEVYFVFDETLTAGDVDFRRNGTVNAVAWRLAPGNYSVESFEPYTLRYLKVLVRGGRCRLGGVTLREYANPDVWTARFHSPDMSLNRIFEAARETFRQNALDIFMDCPSRERAGWLCDSYFTSRVEQSLCGRPRVERNFLENFLLPERFANLPEGMLPMCYPAEQLNGNFIPNWSLWLVLQLEEYLHRSRDRRTVDAFEPKIDRLFRYFERFRNSDGLLEKLERWVFIEWSRANDFVQDVSYPSNMLYAAALAAAGRLYRNRQWSADSARIRETVRRQSFDGEFFVDNAVRRGGSLARTTNRTETCQYYAFYFGAATPDSHGPLWKTLVEKFGPRRAPKTQFPEIHPSNAFVGNYLRLELLSQAGLCARVVDECRLFFSDMALKTGTLWEHARVEASLNHGFASHAARVLQRDALGLFRIDPSGRKVEVRFSDVGLGFCEGQAPVPGGFVSLRWERRGDALLYRLGVPAGYQVEIDNRTGLALKQEG